jgi:hypothetical protein
MVAKKRLVCIRELLTQSTRLNRVQAWGHIPNVSCRFLLSSQLNRRGTLLWSV